MVSLQNRWYGHDYILRRFVGLDRPRPILGFLQHGWTKGMGIQVRWHRLPLPKFVWGPRHLRLSRRHGFPIVPIGAPWLYLDQLVDQGLHLPPPLCEPGSVVAFPVHSSQESNLNEDWPSYVGWLRERFPDPKSLVVCLHPNDARRINVLEILRRGGITTISLGHDRDDDKYLLRLYSTIRCASFVTSNQISTAPIYAAALGVPIVLGGPGGEVRSLRRRDRHRLQQNRSVMSALDSLRQGLESDEGRRHARHELGEQYLQPPEQLADTLGWSRLMDRLLAQSIANAPSPRRVRRYIEQLRRS